MKKIELTNVEWGQVLDGLASRAEQYELTAQYYETGVSNGEILEVSHASEARCIAKFYRSIIAQIEKQLRNN
ncbi:hypothetical protein P4E94_08590 [Pontiellaceae bacterium B12219]|nr:hypothetical protein [Pontiellaceae bacterium B12219]